MGSAEGVVEESMADLVNAYRSIAGADVAKIAMGSPSGPNVPTQKDIEEREFLESVAKALKRVTDSVNNEMIRKQAEFSNSSDMLFSLAEANKAVSSNSSWKMEEVVERFLSKAMEKNRDNKAKGIGCAIEGGLLSELESLIEKRRRKRWVPING